MSYDYIYRIVILGDCCSGKSAFMEKYINNENNGRYLPTIGVDFNAKLVSSPEHTNIKIHMWDTSGNKTFRRIARSYFGGVAGAILLYNTGNRDTFNNLKAWLDELHDCNCYINLPIILVGAQFDEYREITRKQGEEFSKKYNLLYEEVNFTNTQEVNIQGYDILEPLWNQIWYRFVTGNIHCNGVKKLKSLCDAIIVDVRDVRDVPTKNLLQRTLQNMKDHKNDLSTDCIIS